MTEYGDREHLESSLEPNFELPNRDAIHEHNWPEYEALGFTLLTNVASETELVGRLKTAEGSWGTANVFTGDAFDEEAGRPLRHKPGIGIYISPAGDEFMQRRQEAREGLRSHEDEAGPASS